MNTATLPVKRGRPSLADELELELIAERAESREFAATVRLGVDRITAAAAAGDRRFIVNEAVKLGYHASRRLRQLEGLAA